jgi:hypothetical protein
MRYKAQYNSVYRPRLRLMIHWTFKGKTHYVEFGGRQRPPFPFMDV